MMELSVERNNGATQMNYYVERMVNGRAEWLRIEPQNEMWIGSFCLIGEIPKEHVPY